MSAPTPAAMRAAQALYPSGIGSYLYADYEQNLAARNRDWLTIARKIDEATGLPKLVAATRYAFDEACSDNTNQQLIDELDAALEGHS